MKGDEEMEKGVLQDLLEDIIALATNYENDEIIALCESIIKELSRNAQTQKIVPFK